VTWRATLRRWLPFVAAGVGGFGVAYLVIALFVFPPGLAPEEEIVPNVVGSSYDRAVRDLTKMGFQTKRGDTRIQATVPPGTVLEQDPRGGLSERKGTRITLHVSTGDKSVAVVPAVVGRSTEDARAALVNAGFEIDSILTTVSTRPVGIVVGTRPPPSTSVRIPAHVSLVVSSGPAVVRVPNLKGQTFSQALGTLQRIGLIVGDVTVDSTATAVPAQTVVDQSPEPNTEVAGGTPVALRLALGGVR
jgi:serine/threonine-protein kinase